MIRRGPWTALVLAAVGALFFSRIRARVDPDLFFHLKDGARVVFERHLPLVEQYSYTRPGRELIATEWLSSAVFFVVFHLGGYPLLAAFSALMLVAALWIMTRAIGRETPDELRAAIAALAAFGLLNFALAKLYSFTFVLFALFLLWIRRWEQGKRWAPWAMAATLALWVNLHGGFMLGWGLLGAVCLLDAARERRAAALAPWALGTFACFLSPDGATNFVYPLWFVFAPPHGRAAILEWTPLPWRQASAAPYALMLAAAAAARVDRRLGRFPWALLVALLFAMGLRSRKMMPLFVLGAGAAIGWARAGAALGARRAKLCLAAAAASLLAIAAVEIREARALEPLGPASDWEREYPRAGADEIAARYPGRRLFHPYEWGGYLIYRLAPRTPVFIDGRLDPYWTLLDDYADLIEARPGWEALAAGYGIEVALLPRTSPLALALARHPRWKVAGEDARVVLYARRDLKP